MGKRLIFAALLLALLLTFGGCTMLSLEGEPVAEQPFLELLSMPAYREQETVPDEETTADVPLRVDLWLDASQVMGGVNPNEESLYPHHSRKYREGGFHYRYGQTAGWYETVLQDLLEAANGLRTRVLRVGNERLTDSFLQQNGFAANDEEALRSYRRDLLTYAIDPLPDLFEGFSAENMTDSFYSLGSPQLNQMQRFAGNNGALLENPGMVGQMSDVLNRQIAAFADEDKTLAAAMDASRKDDDSPLQYALNNLDLTRLSVITCDPAALRRLSGTQTDGTPVDRVQELLTRRGVFEQGLTVELYAMQLDYMGQMISFSIADFSEPLLWGRLKYDNKNYTDEAAEPMPRILLVLMIGQQEQVESYSASFNTLLDSDSRLQELRGPQEGDLAYTAEGSTVVQQPFAFRYQRTRVNRPRVDCYTQNTPGMTLEAAEGTVDEKDGLQTVALSAEKGKTYTITCQWPAEAPEGVAVDLTGLSGLQAQVMDSLLLSRTMPNTAENQAALAKENVQVLAMRDTLYVFTDQQEPFADSPEQSPFRLVSVSLSEDGAQLTATVEAEGAKLQAGYYRLKLSADLPGQQLSWPEVPWVREWSTTVTNNQKLVWEQFTAVMTQYARELSNIPKVFTHAWGGGDPSSYKGTDIPDFPPVYLAPNLSALLDQLRAAANVDTEPYLRCVFDVFVNELP